MYGSIKGVPLPLFGGCDIHQAKTAGGIKRKKYLLILWLLVVDEDSHDNLLGSVDLESFAVDSDIRPLCVKRVVPVVFAN